MGNPWVERVRDATPPTTLWHATTPKKVGRYRTTGRILPPVRGFDCEDAAREWGRLHGPRTVIVRIEVVSDVWPLPDHHIPEGLAWWTLDGSKWSVVE